MAAGIDLKNLTLTIPASTLSNQGSDAAQRARQACGEKEWNLTREVVEAIVVVVDTLVAEGFRYGHDFTLGNCGLGMVAVEFKSGKTMDLCWELLKAFVRKTK